ncbi:unnamed protein product [Durusdinium trenchii]|uniref:PARP n=1 Tax=Durusdinium trenchii TaxID=1381693 RepID=A0ABP0IS67_9DINO
MTTGQVQGLASQKWALYKLIKTPRVVSLRTMFECWQLITQHRKVHRDQQTASAQAKEDRIQQVLTDARQAADRHDLSRLHQLVRRLNPKEKTTRIQIRDASGRILSPMEEFTSLKQYVQTTWSGAPLPPFRASTGPGIPFTEADLVRALSSLAPLKANAPGTCASLSVLCNPSLIASKLMSLLHLWWHRPDPYIPTSWKSGHLFLLPKPGKPPNSAKNLRPLALQEVFGKAVIGLVSERARASVLDILCSTPQLAYLPFRGTADAIARAVHHCQEVAHLITQFQRPAERQNSQLARTGLIGGALLSLDLSKAFDSVSRDLLFRGMEDLGGSAHKKAQARFLKRTEDGRHDKLDTLDHTDILHQIPLTETQKLELGTVMRSDDYIMPLIQAGKWGEVVPELAPWLLAPDEKSWTFILRHSQELSHKDYAILDDGVWAKLQHKCATLCNLGCALTWLRPEEEMAQPPQEKRARMEDAPRSQQRRRQARRPSPMRSETTRSTSSTRDEDPMPVTKLCRLMGQLLIRHEDSLNSVSMQDSFVMFFQRGNSGAVPLLLRAANQWRDLPPDQTQMPLRSYLLQAILNELVSRFQKLHHQLEDPGTKAAAVKSLTILEDLSFPYLMWHAQQQKLVVSQIASISWTTMESHLGLLQQAFQEPSNCIRFFAMASAQSKGDVAIDGVVPLASDETTRPAEEQNRSGHPGHPPPSQGEAMKHQWINQLLVMQCANTANWCYANAGLVTMFWSLLHSSSFDEYTFRTAWDAVQGLLQSVTADEPVVLASHPCLAELFEGTPHGEQRDIGEFISEALLWCKSSRLSQAWERRFEASGSLCCYESGSDFQPIALVHLYELDKKRVTLTELLTPWLHCHSMTTAFTNSQGPKVFFLDRLIDSTRLLGHFNFVEFMEPVLLPFFLRDGLELRWLAHQVVACVAHLGDSLKGHFRALLKDPQSGKFWLCDDNQPPAHVTEVCSRTDLPTTLRAIADHSSTEVPPSQALLDEPNLQVPAARPTAMMLMDFPTRDDSGHRNLAANRDDSGLPRAQRAPNPDDAALADLLCRLRAADVSIDRRRLELEQQQEVLMNQIHARSDELGQQALHLAARYSNPETIQFLAGLPKPGLHERDFLGRLPLHRAAESGDGELLAALAAFHKPEEILQELDKKQQSTLDLAVLSGSVEALHALNINASSVPERQKRARTPLHLAAQWNHTDVLECLASLGFAVDAEDADLTRPVHLAARFGHRATVAALLGLHADITATTSFGRSALHWAALNGHTEVAEDLLAFRCPLDVRDRAGWTPLHWTLRRCHASCSRSLLEGAADVELVDLKNQRSMLHTAACFNVEPELIEELEAFLTHTATDVSGKTPLHLSAQWGKLLDLKSDLEVRCSHQRTPLYLSARRGNASVSDLLLRRRAELHAADANGVTPLFAAARHGHFKVVLVLVSHQADLTSTEKDGMTAMHWAAKHGNSEAIRELVASVPTNPFALVEATTRFGRSPLHVACIAGKDDAVRVLLDLRSDPAQRQKDGWMPIHLAARFGHEKVIKAMIEAGCDPNVAGVYGKTAAHCLVQREKLHLGFNELPLDVLEADHGGRNVWHLAAALGHTRYFNLYVLARKNSQGCKYMKVLFSLDAKGRTPLHLAAEKGQHLVVKQILSIFLDEEGHFEPRWDLKETYYRRKEEAALEDLLHDEQPPAPPLMADHRGRLPIHLAAEGGFAQVTGMLAKFMLAKQGCTVEQLEVPDLDGFSPLQLALRKKHWEAARRLATWIGREVPELRQVDVQMARRTPLGTKVRVKEDITLESGETLTRGDQGLLESCNETGASLKFDFVVTMSPETFALRCVAEKSYLLNGSCWRRRAKRPFPCLNRQSSEPTEPLMLEDCDEGKSSFSEGDVTRGFDEGTGWLRLMDGSFLPLLLRLDETRLVPALTLWNGPSLKCGQLVRTREAFVQSRATVPPGCVGLVRRIEEEDCATVDFEGQDRRVRVTGPAFFKLQLLPYVTIMEEPKGVPKQGTVVKWRKKEQCGEVVHDGAGSYSSAPGS